VRVVWAGSRDEFQAKPRLYVLAIGVSVYGNPDLRLKFAAKDAKDFAATMKAQEGRLYHEVAVKLLTDDQATRDEIVDGLDWLQKQVTQHDVGVLFLAGHGVNAPDYAFLPVNADLDKIKRTTVGMAEIRDTLNQLAGKAVFFVDTCHAGNVLGTGRRGIGTDMTAVVNELSSAENGVVVFSSSTGREFSVEDEKWGNGAFTAALIEGLRGEADYKKTGRITHKMLDLYITERVKTLTGGRQHPVTISPQGVPDFPFAAR
jgi:uncharacterized caspase-like protein